MTGDRLPLAELMAKTGDGDFLRNVAESVLPTIMEADVDGLIGAGPQHVAQRLPRPVARHPARHAQPEDPQAEGRRLLPGIGYVRVSRADGSQVHDLQRGALLGAGASPNHIYENAASGLGDDRPRLTAALKALPAGDTLVI